MKRVNIFYCKTVYQRITINNTTVTQKDLPYKVVQPETTQTQTKLAEHIISIVLLYEWKWVDYKITKEVTDPEKDWSKWKIEIHRYLDRFCLTLVFCLGDPSWGVRTSGKEGNTAEEEETVYVCICWCWVIFRLWGNNNAHVIYHTDSRKLKGNIVCGSAFPLQFIFPPFLSVIHLTTYICVRWLNAGGTKYIFSFSPLIIPKLFTILSFHLNLALKLSGCNLKCVSCLSPWSFVSGLSSRGIQTNLEGGSGSTCLYMLK